MCCCEGYCSRCRGIKGALVGVLVLLNIWVWPKWTGTLNEWIAFFGVLAVLGGIIRWVKPSCGCPGACAMPAAPAKKSKK